MEKFKLLGNQYEFAQTWDDVPFTNFAKWQNLALLLQQKEKEVADTQAQIDSIAKEYEAEFFGKKRTGKLNIFKIDSQKLQDNLKAIYETLHLLEVEACSYFCTVPVAVLLKFVSREMPIGVLEHDVDMSLFEDDAKHIFFYKKRLFSLCALPLPLNEKTKDFWWQTATDAEIAQLQKEYKSRSLFWKLTPAAFKFRKKIKAATCSRYDFVDVWEQTTYANQKFQEFAVAVSTEIKNGVWANSHLLFAMLFIERGKQINPSTSTGSAVTFVEEYAAQFKAIWERNQDLFFNQQKVVSVGTVCRLNAFFLPKFKKHRNLIQTFFE